MSSSKIYKLLLSKLLFNFMPRSECKSGPYLVLQITQASVAAIRRLIHAGTIVSVAGHVHHAFTARLREVVNAGVHAFEHVMRDLVKFFHGQDAKRLQILLTLQRLDDAVDFNVLILNELHLIGLGLFALHVIGLLQEIKHCSFIEASKS